MKKLNSNLSLIGTVALIGLTAINLAITQANAGIAYQDPNGGWRYIFQGGAKGNGNGGCTALDGTWSYTQGGSSSWGGRTRRR